MFAGGKSIRLFTLGLLIMAYIALANGQQGT